MKFVKTLVTAAALYTATGSTAQTWSWATESSGTAAEYGNAVATDNSGNNYVVGDYSNNPAVFGSYTLSPVGNGDAFLAKYNASGGVLWAVKMAGTLFDYGRDIAMDSGSNILVSGTYRGTITFYSTTATTVALTGSSFTDNMYLAKYNSSGVVQWAINVAGDAECGDLFVVPSLFRVYISGQRSGQLFAACYSYPLSTPPSAPIWTLSCTAPSGTSKAWGITGDNAGNAYLLSTYTGTVSGTLSTGGTFSGTNGMLMTKLSSAGAVTWSVNIGSSGTGAEQGKGIRRDAAGNIYIAGHYTGTANISGTTLSNAGMFDAFVAKYDDTGARLWAKRMGGFGNDYVNAFTANSSGDSYLFLQSTDNNSVPFGCKTYPAVFGNTDNKMILAKYNNQGLEKGSAAPALNNSASFPGGVSLDASGNAILTGHKVGAFIAGTYTLSTGADMFLTKVLVADELPSVASTDVNLCGLGSSTTLSATGPAGSTIKWYNSAMTLLTTGSNYTTPAASVYSSIVYYVSSTVGGCESARLAVTVTTHPYNAISVTPASSTICNGSCVTVNFTNATTARLMPGNVIKTSPFVICPTSSTNYTLTNTATGYCETPGTFTINVTVTDPFAGTFSDRIAVPSGTGCTPAITAPSKPGSSSPVITTTMPNVSGNLLNDFRCSIGNTLGWMGAGNAGVNNLTFVGSYTLDVYEVDVPSGIRKVVGSDVAPSVFIKYGNSDGTDDMRFNEIGWGSAFDTSSPFFCDGSADGDGNNGGGDYFRDFYRYCYDQYTSSSTTAAFDDFSSRVFCIDMKQISTTGGCPITKKTYFRIAYDTDLTKANGSGARMAMLDDETKNNEEEYLSLSVFPNPTSSLVYVPLSSGDSNVQVTLTDNLGKQVMKVSNLEASQGELNLSGLPAGIYFYTILKNNLSYKGKIVKH